MRLLLRGLTLSLATLALAFFGSIAHADTITLPTGACTGTCATAGYTISYSVTPGGSLSGTNYDYTMSFDFNNTSGAAGWIQSMSLTALGGSITGVSSVVSIPGLASGLTASATGNSSGNNSGSSNCTGNAQGAVCVVIQPVAGSGVYIAAGQDQTFTVYVDDATGSILPSWNFKANIENTSYKSIVAISGTGAYQTTTPSPVPEPASLSLLGAGLVGLATWCKRFRK